MIVAVSKKLTFIPAFNKNKECPAADQIVVTIKNPTIQIKQRVTSTPETVARADIRLKTDDIAVLREMLDGISNCGYEDEDGKHSITNAKTLLEAPVEFSPLIDEIVTECNRILTRVVDEKN